VNERIGGEILEIDWRPLIASLADDVADGVAASDIAAGFHQALIEAVATVAEAVGAPRVVISGGCFQNRRLQEGVLQRLPEVGCSVLVQRGVPANDGGISLGQAVIAAARLRG
jgi:hydrogenase maturation protein HypF